MPARPEFPGFGSSGRIFGKLVFSVAGGLTMRLSRNRFAPPTTRQIKLATLLAPLRVSAQLRC